MRRNLIDMIKGLFYSQVGNSEPVQARVENARMSSTRLKALKPVDPKGSQKIVAIRSVAEEEKVDPDDPRTIHKRIKTLAHMSHYRLQAYAATLPGNEPLECSEDAPLHA
jgi:hypothetical protein